MLASKCSEGTYSHTTVSKGAALLCDRGVRKRRCVKPLWHTHLHLTRKTIHKANTAICPGDHGLIMSTPQITVGSVISSRRPPQPCTLLGDMWWAGRRRHSLYAGIQEVAETPWTAPPLCRTTVFLKCQLGTGCGDLSNTSAHARSGGWNSLQTPHRIPDPFPGLTHGGSAGEALQANRSIHPAPHAGSCFQTEAGVFGRRRAVSPPTSAPREDGLTAGLDHPLSLPVMADCSSTDMRLLGAVEHRKKREALFEKWGAALSLHPIVEK